MHAFLPKPSDLEVGRENFNKIEKIITDYIDLQFRGFPDADAVLNIRETTRSSWNSF